MRSMIGAGFGVLIVLVGLANTSRPGRATPEMPEDPLRVADAGGMRCDRVEIRLPNEIVFYCSSGDVLRAQVSTNLPAGTYTLRYAKRGHST